MVPQPDSILAWHVVNKQLVVILSRDELTIIDPQAQSEPRIAKGTLDRNN